MALLRAAIADDIDAIARVHNASWITTYRGLVPDAVSDRLSFRRRSEWWKVVVEEQCEQVTAVKEDDQVEGFAYYGSEHENDPVNRGELFAIYLLRDSQRRGMDWRLIRASAEGLLTLGMCDMLVWVLLQNPACRFYEKLEGVHLRERSVEIGGATLPESAYGLADRK